MSWLRRAPPAQVRWVVIDCEASGLDPVRDRLLSVGAVGVRDERIQLAETWRAVLQQDPPGGSTSGNVLVHGLGGDALQAGRPAAAALAELARFVGDDVPVAFHASFDAALLRTAMAAVPGARLPRRWLDLAALAPALFPQRSASCRALDDWLCAFGIEVSGRHEALADAFAAAQLLLVLLAEGRRQGAVTPEALRQASAARRWLGPGFTFG